MVAIKTFWTDRSVLVTGATGLLGSYLTMSLTNVGASVVCLIRDWIPHSELIRTDVINYVKVVRGDVRNQVLLERILGEYEIDTVFHLAAQTIVTIANRNPISTFDTNIHGTWSLLEACRRSPLVKRIIVASSDKAYGEQEKLPYDETQPLQGSYPYDVSKSCVDLLSQAYYKTYNLPVAVTRCGNLFGGGDLNWNRIIPGTIRSIIRGESPIIRSDGKYKRDYFYIGDAALAYILLAGKLEMDNLYGEAFNFSYESPTNVYDLVIKILKLMDSDLQPCILNSVANEIHEQYLQSLKAHRWLEWSPIIGMERGLDITIDWYRRYFEELNG